MSRIFNFNEWYDKIFEQQKPTIESLPVIDFRSTFKNNMVTLKNVKKEELDRALLELDDNIKKANTEDKDLKSITISIDAGASKIRATNRLPEGIEEPDHNYGKKNITPDKWTTISNKNPLGEVDTIPDGYNPNSGYYAIRDGNKYLANTRAVSLKKYLTKYIFNKYKIKPEIEIKTVDESSEQYASAKIESIVFKRPIPSNDEVFPNFYIEAYGIERDGKYYMGASPAKVWGKERLNSKKDFTLEKAQALADSRITEREIEVIENPKAKGTQGEEWYGLNKPYVEVKGYQKVSKDKNIEGVFKWWFETYEKWLSEKNNLQKFREDKFKSSENQQKTSGAAGTLDRVPTMHESVPKPILK